MPVTRYEFLQYRSVDILMGTFTKSFGAAGEHVAGNKTLLDLRMHAHAHAHLGVYAESMTPSVLTQIVSSMVSTLGVAPPNVSLDTIPLPGPVAPAYLPQWMDLLPNPAFHFLNKLE